MQKFTDTSYNRYAQYIFMISIVLTVFAPAVHYVGFALSLFFLIYGRIRYKDAIFPRAIGKQEKLINCLMVIFFIWSAFLHLGAVDNFHTWGRGASVYLEMLLWYFFTMRLFCTDNIRKTYISMLVVITTLIFCMIICVFALGWFKVFHNLSMNLNALGLYATLAFPYIFYYSLWIWPNSVKKYVTCSICALVSVICFSSGAWLAIIVMLPLIIYFAWSSNKLSMKSMSIGLCLAAIALVCVNSISNGAILKRFTVELAQVSALDKMDSLTNHRYSIWIGTIKMISGRPLTGYGRDSFDAEHARLLAHDAELAKATGVFDHAHNTYLELAFAGGWPSAVLFVLIVMLLIKKCWENRRLIENGIPWNMIHLTLLAGMIVYGLTGDVFEARRDLAVIFWTALGIMNCMPERHVVQQK